MADKPNWRMATPEENAEVEDMLTEARVRNLDEWTKSLKAMREQLGQILEEIEEFERILA